MSVLQCYNKGCGAKYLPEENTGECCRYHPGEPIFHDAKKKWSCCKKFSTDFSEFLNIKGCTFGIHSNVRPSKPEEKTAPANVPVYDGLLANEPTAPKPISPPSSDKLTSSDSETMRSLPVDISPSLINALAKLASGSNAISGGDVPNQMMELAEASDTTEVAVGTKCKNNGCSVFFTDDLGQDNGVCRFHPGPPVFHEGMKYWSCCRHQTTDFEVFTRQGGCVYGRHKWTEKPHRGSQKGSSEGAFCRHDWFQFARDITISIYARLIRPETLSVMANDSSLTVSFQFGQAPPQKYEKTFRLFKLINPVSSVVKAGATKLEVVLKKERPTSWLQLEAPPPPKTELSDSADSDNYEPHVCWAHD